MDTLENMKKAINYIDEHLDSEIEYEKIAQIALCSQYHFQRMFSFLIGIPLSGYIRRRRYLLMIKKNTPYTYLWYFSLLT
jgi:AraC family transcriptional regulator